MTPEARGEAEHQTGRSLAHPSGEALRQVIVERDDIPYGKVRAD